MLNKIFRNWPIKLLSVFLAVVVWFFIMSLADPAGTQTYNNIPVQLLNEDLLTQAGKSYTLENGDNPTVSIRVSAAGSVHRELSSSDFTATADIAKMFDVTGRVPIEVSCNNAFLSNQINSITLTNDSLKINFENIVTKEFAVSIETKNDLPEGYFISKKWANPASVTITAPESVMDRIASVVAEVDVTGLTESASMENIALEFLSGTGQSLNLAASRDTKVSVENVTVGLDVYTMKTLPVVISQEALDKVKNQVPDGYRYIKAQQTISNVQVKGLMSRLADLSMISIPESAFSLVGAKESKSFELDLNDYLPTGIELMDGQEAKFTVTLEVVELAVREFVINNLRVTGQNEDYRYQFSRSVKVYIRALESDFVEFDPSTISATVDLGSYATREGTHRLAVTVSCTDNVFTPLQNRSFVEITVTKYVPPTTTPEETEEDPENAVASFAPGETLPSIND